MPCENLLDLSASPVGSLMKILGKPVQRVTPDDEDSAHPHRCFVEGWGVAARISASREVLLQAALRGLPPGFRVSRRPNSGPRFPFRTRGGAIQTTVEGRIVRLGPSREQVTAYMESRLESLASTRSPKFAFLHAGCVEIEGCALILPGRSGAGKSTLVAEFVKGGARYLSDDLAPIDARLRVHPFPRPLGIRPARGGGATRASLHALGIRPAARARPLTLVWCGSFDPLASASTFTPQSAAQAFAALLAHAPGAQVRPEVIVPILAGIARDVPVFVGVRGEAAEMVAAVRARLRRPSSKAGTYDRGER